jgi:hypothetical protein
MAEYDPAVPQTPDSIIQAARDCVREVESAESENRQMAEKCLDFKAGNHWPDALKTSRSLGPTPRPCLVLNVIPIMTSQVTNDFAQNPPSVQIYGVDDRSDPKLAEIFNGMWRDTLNQSLGENAVEVAFGSAVDIGTGYLRLYTEYVNQRSFEQEIKLGALVNPFAVYFDPRSVRLDGSDAKEVVIVEQMREADFRRQYPGAQVSTTSLIGTEMGQQEWGEDSCEVAEYYCCEYVSDVLMQTAMGPTVWQSELEQQPQLLALIGQAGGIRQTRPVQREQIKWYKLTAAEVLEERLLPGEFIPVLPIYGNRILNRGKVKRFGLIEPLMDPQLMLDFWETTKTEWLALQPRAPWVGPMGFMAGHEPSWRNANNSNVVALEYNLYDELGRPLSAPQRQAPPPLQSGVIEAAGQSREYMREISGISQPAQTTPGSDRSGRSLQIEEMQADMATFHYFHHAHATLLHACRIFISWLPAYYSSERIVRTLGEDGRTKTAMLNQRVAINQVLNEVSVGRYDVMPVKGPNYETKRQEAVAGMQQIAAAFPKLLDVAGSDYVRSQNWPGAEQMAKKLALSEPQLPEDTEDPETALPKVMGQLQKREEEARMLNVHAEQMEQQVQQLQQENATLKTDRQAVLGELQIKQAELVIKERDLQLKELEIQYAHQEAMAKLELEREKIQASWAQAQARGEERSTP